ncbi:MAG: sugar ABC transporter substrate-binding protein [Planctomycetota bacterium]|jgi:inositol transport system substrate-binding protein|nr:sugar ABC transporter substrate-binding protein [Planctomycetota bacterium]
MKCLAKTVLAALFVCCLAAGASAGEKLRIAFLFQDLETEFWVAGHQAITETLRGQGIEVIEFNSNQDANRQLEQLRSAINQRVDGIMVIPHDGNVAVTMGKLANRANIPYGVFNRPPSSKDIQAVVVVADNRTIAAAAVEYMCEEALKLGRKFTPAIVVGDLADPNAVERRNGFYDAVNNPKYKDLWIDKPIEIMSKWDANVLTQNFQSAMQANPDIDFLFTSSDFLIPNIKAVLAPLGKWEKVGHPKHVIFGGLDGDKTACGQIEEGYLDSTGVQDVFAEAEMLMNALVAAIQKGDTKPNEWLYDPGFALTHGNFGDRCQDMWGCKLMFEERGK